MSDILQWARSQGLAQPLEGAGEGDFVDVVQGSFAGGLAGMLETGDVLRREAEGALGIPERDVLATGMARALRGVQARNQPAPEARGTFWGEDFPSGLGSVGSFAITGLAGNVLGLSARAGAALSSAAGFVQSAGPAFYEAKARGRDDMTAWTAFLAHGAAGATEGLGSVVPGIARLGAWFAKADRTTGGSLSRSVLGSMLNVGKAGAREGLQETGQGFLGGAIDAYLLKYPDAQRDLVEILKDRAVREGAPGAVIGVLFGGLEQAVYRGAQERAGTTLVGKSPEVQAEKQTPTTGAPVVAATPEESAALDRLRKNLGDTNTVIVEDVPEYAPALEFGRKRGHTVRTVRAPQGFEGYFDEDTGTIFVREGMRPTEAMDVVRGHEMAHALKSRNLGAWQELRDEIAGVDSAGLAEFEAAAAARYEEVTGNKLGDDLAQEEGVSYWTQNVLSPWLRQLERNPDRLAALAVDNRTFFRKLVEAGMDVLNSLGAKFKTRRADLAQLRAELGTAGARITPDQGRALAQRYMQAMGGLEAEFGAQEAEAQFEQMRGAQVEPAVGAEAMLESEQVIGAEQALEGMRRTPPLLPAAPVEGVRRVFEPTSPTVQRQLGAGEVRSRALQGEGRGLTFDETWTEESGALRVEPNIVQLEGQARPQQPMGVKARKRAEVAKPVEPKRSSTEFDPRKPWKNTTGFRGEGAPMAQPETEALSEWDKWAQRDREAREARALDDDYESEGDRVQREMDRRDYGARFALAFHGTPHDFDRFTTEKIGTGEGAQAYGWGLYFASKRGIAEHYRERLGTKTRGYSTWDGKKITRTYPGADHPWGSPEQELFNIPALKPYGNTDQRGVVAGRARLLREEQRLLQDRLDARRANPPLIATWSEQDYMDRIEAIERRVKVLDEVSSRLGYQEPRENGRLYEVELAPQEDEYLLWDAPLSEQSEKVKAALRGFGYEERSAIQKRHDALLAELLPLELSGAPMDGRRGDLVRELDVQSVRLNSDISRNPGGDFYRSLERKAGGDANASRSLRAAGIRGIKYLDGMSRGKGDGSYNYVVFDENDVSVVARFAFALSDTLADTALGEHIEMRKAAYRDAYKAMFRKVVDYLDPVREAMPNEYRSEMLRASKTGQRIDNEMRPMRDAFVESMRKHGIKLDEIGDFIQARGAGLRNYYMGLINERELEDGTRESIEGLSGMSNDEAARILAAAKASGKYDGYVDLARQYDAINKRVREIWRESGDRTAKYIDEIEQKYSHEAALKASEDGGIGVADPEIAWDSYYTAFRTEFDEESLAGVGSDSARDGAGRGLGVSGSPVRSALGRKSRASNPIPFAFVDLQTAIIRAGKLEIARKIAAHVEARNDPQFARVVSVPMRRGLNPESGVVEDMPDPAWKSRPDTLAFKTEDGKVRAIIFSRKYAHLAPILKGHTLSQPAFKLVAKMTRAMAGLLTRQNPAFFAVNYFRDLAQTVLAAHSKQGPDFARAVVAKQAKAMTELRRAEFGGERSAQMQEYLDSGARMGSQGFQDYADTAKAIEATLRGGRVREAGANFLRLIERFNDIAENATRYAVYQTARERRMSIDEAAILAKQEIGVNFERKGEYGPALSSLYAFAQAGINGNVNALKAMATKRGAGAVAAITALGFVQDQMNRALSGEDDDGELVYDNRPEWQKNANMLIELGGDSALQIPMPHAWRWFYNFGRRASAWSTAGIYGASDFADLAYYEVFDTLNPLGAGPVAQMAAPTVADPLVQLSSNQTWTGKKIAPENLPFGAQKPDSDLYWRGTNELSIALAQALSEITDGDDSGDGLVEISPNTIEHFARVAFGGLGATAVNLAENVGSLASGELPTPKEAAVLNRFWAQNSPWAIDTRYSDTRKEIESAKARYIELRKMGEGPRALEWRRANITLFKAIGALEATERSLSNLPNTPANEVRRREVKARFNRRLNEIKASQA